MDDKTLGYMAKRVDTARKLGACIKSIEKMPDDIHGETPQYRPGVVLFFRGSGYSPMPEAMRRFINNDTVKAWLIERAGEELAELRRQLEDI